MSTRIRFLVLVLVGLTVAVLMTIKNPSQIDLLGIFILGMVAENMINR